MDARNKKIGWKYKRLFTVASFVRDRRREKLTFERSVALAKHSWCAKANGGSSLIDSRRRKQHFDTHPHMPFPKPASSFSKVRFHLK